MSEAIFNLERIITADNVMQIPKIQYARNQLVVSPSTDSKD
jgi:hypothetical protein